MNKIEGRSLKGESGVGGFFLLVDLPPLSKGSHFRSQA